MLIKKNINSHMSKIIYKELKLYFVLYFFCEYTLQIFTTLNDYEYTIFQLQFIHYEYDDTSEKSLPKIRHRVTSIICGTEGTSIPQTAHVL